MEPHALRHAAPENSALSSEAVRIHLGPEIRPERMKNYLLRIARELNVPVTVRRVPGGVIFWRSSEEDLQQAQEAAGRLQTGGRRPPGSSHRPPAAENTLRAR